MAIGWSAIKSIIWMDDMTIDHKWNIGAVKDVSDGAKIRAHIRQMIFKALRQCSVKSDMAPTTEQCLESVA